MKKITIIGAGLTGSLLAILLGKRGHQVEIYEKNDAPNVNYTQSGKSISLTLSRRSFDVLKKAGVYNDVLAVSAPVYGRCLHLNHNEVELQPYGNHHEALYAISRKALNNILLKAALKVPGVSIIFNQKCINYDLNNLTLTLKGKGEGQKKQPFELLIGADGVHSKIRSQIQCDVSLNYSQYSNKELIVPAEVAKDAKLLTDYIHLWPRGKFMLIAFPNHQGDFICTLQLPTDNHPISFKQIDTELKLLDCFKMLFPDLIQLIPDLKKAFFKNSEMSMLTVRCSKWHIQDKVLLIGDAAHAIWPSYGQGMNAGFEDCEALDLCLTQYPKNTLKAIEKFQETRKKNTDAIAKLSEDHFNELKQLVADPNFLLRKKVERQINLLFPSEYFCTYSRVSFTSMPYSEAVSLESKHKQIIDELLTFPEITSNLNSPMAKKRIYQTVNRFKQTIT